jgi:hypothetical protein
MNAWATVMLVAGGLFAGGAASVAWSRVPIWRQMALPEFVGDFAQTLRRTDMIQPALLVTAVISAAAVAVTHDGDAAMLAALGAAGLVLVLGASAAFLVPLQRRLIATPLEQPDAIEAMRRRWFRANLGRSVVSTIAFAVMVAGATV